MRASQGTGGANRPARGPSRPYLWPHAGKLGEGRAAFGGHCPFDDGALRRPLEPSHDVAQLIEIAIFDVNRPAVAAMIDRDRETQRV
jgi:hypothetical protein